MAEPSTWATPEDLYERFGDEFVDKLAIRRKWNSEIEDYVADESDEGKLAVIELALEDAKQLLLQKLSCLYGELTLLEDDTYAFTSILQWHIKLTIETLKIGGDCYACACIGDLDKFLGCGTICTPDGVCLPGLNTFISASVAHFKCECHGRCGCC